MGLTTNQWDPSSPSIRPLHQTSHTSVSPQLPRLTQTPIGLPLDLKSYSAINSMTDDYSPINSTSDFRQEFVTSTSTDADPSAQLSMQESIQGSLSGNISTVLNTPRPSTPAQTRVNTKRTIEFGEGNNPSPVHRKRLRLSRTASSSNVEGTPENAAMNQDALSQHPRIQGRLWQDTEQDLLELKVLSTTLISLIHKLQEKCGNITNAEDIESVSMGEGRISRRRWTEAEDKELNSMNLRGLSPKEISVALKRTKGSVTQRMYILSCRPTRTSI